MSISRTYAVFLRYLYILWSNPQRIGMIFIWSVTDIILWGFLTRFLNETAQSGINFITMLLGAIILWSFLIRAQQGVSTPALEDVWSRNLFNYFASPLKVSEYVIGLMALSIVIGFVALSVMLVLALIFFGFSIVELGIAMVGFLLTLFLTGLALGIFGMAIIIRYGPSAEWFIWPIPALIQPFVGVFYPITVLPEWMQYISYTLPPSYVFSGMRDIVLNGRYDVTELLFGISLAVVYLVGSYFFFVRIHRYAVKHGLIARYSAES